MDQHLGEQGEIPLKSVSFLLLQEGMSHFGADPLVMIYQKRDFLYDYGS